MPPELVTITLDGRTVQVPKGTLLIEACAQQGIYVPRFCYHEHLVPYAGCRMCLVDVEKMPKLATACSTPVAEGMVVHTANEKVRLAREGVLEFILVSHPLDCPVCDKGGECDLQDQTFLYGRADSQVVDVKRFHRNFDLSSTIKLDYNRCILCKRCVRFTEEIGDDDRLIFRERGAYTEISTQTGEAFNSRFGGEVIEYCPVGALTDQVFRFRARPWEIKEKPSTCGECAMGCANTLHVRANNVVRIFSREKSDLNGYYICDRGRFHHEFKDHPERITSPLLRRNGRLEPVGWEEALAWAAHTLTRTIQADGPHSVAGLIGATRSLEDLFAFKALMEGLGSPHLDHWPAAQITPPAASFWLDRAVPFPQVVQSTHLLLWDSHLFDELPMLALRVKQSREGLVAAWGPANKSKVRSISSTRSLHSRYDWVTEEVAPPGAQEALLLAIAEGLADRSRPSRELQTALAQAQEAVRLLAAPAPDTALVKALCDWLLADDALLAVGQQVLLQDPRRVALLELVIRLREQVRGKPLGLLMGLPAANSAGALALGIQPRWDKRGPVGADAARMAQMLAHGKLKALVLADAEVARDWPAEALEAAGQLECFITAAWFLDDLTAQAHLVLPLSSWFEDRGLTLNPEGRVQEIVPGMTPPSGIRAIREWCSELALHANQTVPGRLAAVRSALEQMPNGLHGLGLVNPQLDGWRERTGSPAAPDMSALSTVQRTLPGTGEMRLLVRRPFWVPDVRMDHSPTLQPLVQPFQVRMHPADARRLGIERGAQVTLSTSQGHCTGPVQLSRGIPEGYVEVDGGHRAGRIGFLGTLKAGELAVRVELASVPQEVTVA